MDHYHYHHGSVAGALPPSAAPVQQQQHPHLQQQPSQLQLPIAPSPLSTTAGQKRKLFPSNSASIVTSVLSSDHNYNRSSNCSDHNHNISGVGNLSTSIPRRDTAPAISTSGTTATSSSHTATATATTSTPIVVSVSPSDYWKGLLNEWNVPILDTVGIEQDDTEDRVDFLETTPDRIEAYQNIELLTAVRKRDLPTLTRIAAENAANNSTMNACNRFGESILHLACRKGSVDVVELLVGVQKTKNTQPLPGCGCSLLVRDDYGRTVLHDACWTIAPPWQIIKLILKKAPVLWRVSDVRGHLALQYVPKTAWPQWTAFLTKNKELLKRIMIHSYHRVDIAHVQHVQPIKRQLQQPVQQQRAHPAQQQQNQTRAQAPANDSSSSSVPSAGEKIPQHQQQQPLHHPFLHMRKSLDSIANVTATVTSSANATTTKTTGPLIVGAAPSKATPAIAAQSATPSLSADPGALARQANAVLAKALAQANPAMVQALSMGVQPRQSKQGVQAIPSVVTSVSTSASAAIASTVTAMNTNSASTSIAHHPQFPAAHTNTSLSTQPAAVLLASVAAAPGPATAALDEALKAQAEMRAQKRSEQQVAAPKRMMTHGNNIKHEQQDHQLSQQQQQSPSSSSSESNNNNSNDKQVPLPYAPSISMIAKRLAGYKKATAIKDEQLQQQAHQQHQQQQHLLQKTKEEPQDQQVQVLCHPVESQHQQHVNVGVGVLNPFPAVPNPLLTTSENELVQNEEPAQSTVPSSITTTQRTASARSHTTSMDIPCSSTTTTKGGGGARVRVHTAVPNPMFLASGDKSSGVPIAGDDNVHHENSSEDATVGIESAKTGIRIRSHTRIHSSSSNSSRGSDNSTSSLTMSASHSETEQQETSSTSTDTTNSDCGNGNGNVDAAASASLASNATHATAHPNDSSIVKNEAQEEETDLIHDAKEGGDGDTSLSISDADCNKSNVSETTKRIVG